MCEKRIKAKNGESEVGEKMLYHGTKKDSCAPIEMSGFNRSYAHSKKQLVWVMFSCTV